MEDRLFDKPYWIFIVRRCFSVLPYKRIQFATRTFAFLSDRSGCVIVERRTGRVQLTTAVASAWAIRNHDNDNAPTVTRGVLGDVARPNPTPVVVSGDRSRCGCLFFVSPGRVKQKNEK